MVNRLGRRLAHLWSLVGTHPDRDRGAETVDIVLWIAVTIVVVGGIGLLFRDSITEFFNGLVFEIGLGGSGSGG